METIREHILPFHHEIICIEVSKMDEITNNAVGWIIRHTDGQRGVRGETAVPIGGLDHEGDIYV